MPNLPDPLEPLHLVQPPDGVKLLSTTPSRTGEGGQGVVARYSDGTTVSAMLNSDGSVTVLVFRAGQMLPAIPIPLDAGATGQRRFTWRMP